MKKRHLLTQPTRIDDLSFDDLYDDISNDWEGKAERLQVRRWRKIKNQLA